jgi:hypothetical protein
MAATVGSLRLCDHVVALDGAYAWFPDGRPSSGPDAVAEIQGAAAGAGFTYEAPLELWDSEAEKRTRLLEIAGYYAKDGWLLVVDGDEVIRHAPAGLRADLAATEHDVATYQLRDEDGHTSPVRGLYRNGDLRYEGHHYWLLRDGVPINSEHHPFHATGLEVQHRQRTGVRHQAAREYHRRRLELGLETPLG